MADGDKIGFSPSAIRCPPSRVIDIPLGGMLSFDRRIGKMRQGTNQKDKLVALRRIEGQVRGLHRMIEERRYCIDILNAAEAVVGALKNVEAAILKDHLNACVRHAFEGKSSKDKEAKLEEIHKLFKGIRK